MPLHLRCRPDFLETPAKLASLLRTAFGPSVVIHGHHRPASKIAYTTSLYTDTFLSPNNLLRGSHQSLAFAEDSKYGPWCRIESPASELSPNTYHTPGTLFNSLV